MTVLLAGLRGCVLGVGVGRGRNFPYYPASVTRLIAVEPSRRRRNRARAAARQASTQIEIVPGTAEDLPAQDGDYDAVVACLVSRGPAPGRGPPVLRRCPILRHVQRLQLRSS